MAKGGFAYYSLCNTDVDQGGCMGVSVSKGLLYVNTFDQQLFFRSMLCILGSGSEQSLP